MYKCGWNGCEKAYGTLNHLNAHVTMQSHGQKRTPEGMFYFIIILLHVLRGFSRYLRRPRWGARDLTRRPTIFPMSELNLDACILWWCQGCIF